MFCWHRYGKIEVDGYQYCTKCGKALAAKCNHSWKVERYGRLTDSYTHAEIGSSYVSRCDKCGKLKYDRFSVRDY